MQVFRLRQCMRHAEIGAWLIEWGPESAGSPEYRPHLLCDDDQNLELENGCAEPCVVNWSTETNGVEAGHGPTDRGSRGKCAT